MLLTQRSDLAEDAARADETSTRARRKGKTPAAAATTGAEKRARKRASSAAPSDEDAGRPSSSPQNPRSSGGASPLELWSSILFLLDPESRLAASSTCKFFRSTALSEAAGGVELADVVALNIAAPISKANLRRLVRVAAAGRHCLSRFRLTAEELKSAGFMEGARAGLARLDLVLHPFNPSQASNPAAALRRVSGLLAGGALPALALLASTAPLADILDFADRHASHVGALVAGDGPCEAIRRLAASPLVSFAVLRLQAGEEEGAAGRGPSGERGALLEALLGRCEALVELSAAFAPAWPLPLLDRALADRPPRGTFVPALTLSLLDVRRLAEAGPIAGRFGARLRALEVTGVTAGIAIALHIDSEGRLSIAPRMQHEGIGWGLGEVEALAPALASLEALRVRSALEGDPQPPLAALAAALPRLATFQLSQGASLAEAEPGALEAVLRANLRRAKEAAARGEPVPIFL
eukprot:tig00001623_g9422.t1